jgi:hypothetical protein
LTYFAEFSAAAYCDPNHVPGTEVRCGKNICPTIEKNTVTTIIEFAEYVHFLPPFVESIQR